MSCPASQYRRVCRGTHPFKRFQHIRPRGGGKICQVRDGSGKGRPPLYSESHMQFRRSLDFIKGGISPLLHGDGGNRSLRAHLNDNKRIRGEGLPPF
ncbi:Uncharacterised protein [Escherichia coli]|uniref:Uncharacterized protein n=1 Tax=Escherichia coli TaxID=562 RepID=A0A377FBA2_ECOLX|nr:Uncharacterised protein [Escherichia coli]